MSEPTVPIVTIDGPSSSGKGTISRIVAARVGWNLLDSGALYRLVAVGRDMGTVIFPAARLKVFLTASAEERAQRRHKQLIGKGTAASLAALSREIAERDLRDSTRQVAPLKPAPDAHLLDSTGL